MHDAEVTDECVTNDSWQAADRELFLAAFHAVGARTDQQRAELLGTSRRNVYRYINGKTDPKLSTARRIADLLGRDVDQLWPRTTRRKSVQRLKAAA